jgi:hypothetical protein
VADEAVLNNVHKKGKTKKIDLKKNHGLAAFDVQYSAKIKQPWLRGILGSFPCNCTDLKCQCARIKKENQISYMTNGLLICG